jgi:hypothetical protein
MNAYIFLLKTLERKLQIAENQLFARNRRILQETEQDLPGASPISRSNPINPCAPARYFM